MTYIEKFTDAGASIVYLLAVGLIVLIASEIFSRYLDRHFEKEAARKQTKRLQREALIAEIEWIRRNA